MTGLAADEGETLDTGCLDGTPAGDNLLLDYARAEAAAFATLARAANGRAQCLDAFGAHVADLAVPTPFGNTVHLTRPIPHHAVEPLATTLHEFFDAAPAGGPFLVFSPWPIGDLAQHGFHRVGHPPLMLRASTVPVAATNPALRVVAVEDAAQLEDFERTLVEAYPAPEMQPFAGSRLLGAPILGSDWRLFSGYDGERCVATAAAWLDDATTIVEMVSVRDECRGRGFGTAITAAATHAEPGRTAMLIASDLGRPIYDQLGYLPLLRYTLYLGMRN